MGITNTSCETVTPSDAISRLWEVWERLPIKVAYTAQSRLYRALFCDIAQLFPNFVVHDFSYLMARIVSEGGSVYLEKLPELGKAFETSLITGEEFIIPRGWEVMKETRLPKFCYQLFSQLFTNDGSPRFEYQYESTGVASCAPILHRVTQFLRQLCMMWSKVELFTDVEDQVPGDSRTKLCAKSQKALDGFIERVSRSVSFNWDADTREAINEARRLLRLVFTTPCKELDELKQFVKSPWGRHGPGAVAGREVGPEKWLFNKWPGMPSKIFSWRDGMDCEVQVVDRQHPARLCLVPKDFRGPRVICIEPKENQFAQQGIMDILYRLTERCALTRRSINFLDTARSQQACYDYRFATIDLKDASDTINLALARLLLPRWVFKLVTRYRSREIITPAGLIRSRCLATMGNATCFPLETLIFWALSLGSMIVLRDSYPLRSQKHLNLEMRVFGDDIIVPLWSCDYVARILETAGLTLNRSKTCQFSLVRESCGEWVFSGRENKIVRFHSLDVVDYRSFLQWSSLLIDLEGKEFPCSLKGEIFSILNEFKNRLEETCKRPFRIRYNKTLQRKEIFVPSFVQEGRLQELTDAAGLYAWHVGNDRTPFLRGARKRVKMGWQDYSLWQKLLEW